MQTGLENGCDPIHLQRRHAEHLARSLAMSRNTSTVFAAGDKHGRRLC